MKSNKLYRIFALILTIAMLVNMFAGTIAATEEPTPPASEQEGDVPTQPTDEPEQGNAAGTTALKAWLTLEETEETTEATPSEEPTEPTTTAAEEEPTESSEETPAQRTVKIEEPIEETTTEPTEETTTEPTEETTTEPTEETTTEPTEETTTEPTEETTTEATEATTQAPAKIIYTYTLHVMIGNNEIPFDGTDTKLQSVTWKMAGAQEAPADVTISNTYETETDATVEATVVYDGLVLALSSEKNLVTQTDSAEDAEAKKLTWGIASGASVSGTIFTSMKGSATLTMPTLNEGCSFAEGVTWSVDADELKLENNTLTLEAIANENTQNVTVSAIGKDKTVYAQSTVEVALVEPDLEFAVEASDKLIGVDAVSTIKFIVTEKTEGHLAGFNAELYSAELINAETKEPVKKISDLTFTAGQHGDKEAQIATWSIAASEEIKDGNYTIVFAENEASVTIDTTAPVVELIVNGKIYTNEDTGYVYVMPEGAEVKNDGEHASAVTLDMEICITDENYSNELLSNFVSTICDAGVITTIELDKLIGEIKDDAGNPAKEILVREPIAEGSNMTVFEELAPNGVLYVDRESPSVEFPEASIDRVGAEDLTAEKIEFRATIKVNDNGSGIKEVNYEVTDPMGALEKQSGLMTDAVGEGNYTFEIMVKDGKETNQGTVSITATDNVGNCRTMTYSEKICADRRAPEVTVTLPQDPFMLTESGVEYYAAEQTVSLKVKEINFAEEEVTVSILIAGEDEAIIVDEATFAQWNDEAIWTITEEGAEASFTVKDTAGRMIKAIIVDMEDAVGNKAEPHEEAASFIVDTKSADIDIIMPIESATKTPETDEETPADEEITEDIVEYYSKDQKIVIKVYEDNFDDKNTTVKYTLSDGTELNVKNEVIEEGTDLSATWGKKSDQNGSYYMTEFDIIDTNGSTVESVTVEAALMAEDDRTVTDDSDKFVVDTTASTLSITMPQDATVTDPETSEVTPNEPNNQFGEISYYQCAQTITLKIEETNFDKSSAHIELTLGDATYTEAELGDVDCITWSDWNSDNGVHTATIKVDDTKGLTVESVKVYFEDKAATSVEETVEDKKFVVDEFAPTMDIAFSDNVNGFYMTESANEFGEVTVDTQKIYLILDNPLTTEMIDTNIADVKQEVTVTVTIKDDNITDGENNYFVANLDSEESRWNMTENQCSDNETDTIVHTYEVEVDANETAEIPLLFSVRDLAGRKPADFNVDMETEEKGVYTSFNVEFDEEGKTDKSFIVDRTQATTGAESEPPVINALIPETTMTAANGMPLYNEGFKATFTVYDYDSGIKSIEWMIDDGLEEKNFFDASWTSEPYSSTMRFAAVTAVVDLEGQENETNNAKLVVKVTDNVGNVITKTYLFAVDTKPTEIEITMPQDLENNNPNEEGTDYYSTEQRVTIQVKDINFTTGNATVQLGEDMIIVAPSNTEGAVAAWESENVWQQIPNTDTYEAVFVVRDTSGLVVNNVNVSVIDNAHNKNSEKRIEPFVVDTTPAEIDIIMPNEQTNANTESTPEEETDIVEYYNSNNNPDIVVKVYEDNFDKQDSKVYYTLSDGTELNVRNEIIVEGTDLSATWERGSDENGRYYKTTFKVSDTNGRTVTGVTVTAVMIVEESKTEIDNSDEFVVDTVDPVLSITMPQDATVEDPETSEVTQNEPDNQFGNISYYQGTQTITLEIVETNFDAESATIDLLLGGMTYTYTEENIGDAECITWSGWTSDNDVHTATIEVNDTNGLTVESVKFDFSDKAANSVEKAVKDKKFVIDEIAPKVEVEFSENVVGFYHETDLVDGEFVTNSNTVYLRLDNPINGKYIEDDELAIAWTQPVTVTVTITDDNLLENSLNTVDSLSNFVVSNAYLSDAVEAWKIESVSCNANQADSIVYKIDISVLGNEVEEIPLMLQVQDLAGRKPEIEQVVIEETVTDTNGNEITKTSTYDVEFDDEGKTNETIWIDNQQAILEIPEDVIPDIQLNLPQKVGVSTNGKPLYNGSFDIGFEITDNDSGLYKVKWSIDDDLNGEYFTDAGEVIYDTTVREEAYTAKVDLGDRQNATNDAILTIVATDNVGNSITYTYEFAVDTKATEISIDMPQDHDTGYNTIEDVDYYKDNQTINLTVNDINFEPANTVVSVLIDGVKTVISTEEGATAKWVETWTTEDAASGIYTTSFIVYDTVGRTIENVLVETTDKAGWDSEAKVERAFVVDTNLPVAVITLPQERANNNSVNTFDPMDYYDANQTVYLQITDDNFFADYTTVYYIKNGERVDCEVEWTAAEGSNVYKASFLLKDTEGLSIDSVTVKTKDMALNTLAEGIDGLTDADPFIVDTNLPVAVITLPQERANNNSVNTFDPMDYYDANQTVYLQITDDNFFADYTTVYYIKNGERVDCEVEWTADEGSNVYKASFLLEDTEGLSIDSVTVKTKDMALNTLAEGIDGLTDADPFVIDTVKPKVNISFSDNVIAFYNKKLNDTEADANTVYLMLDETVNAGNEASKQVTVTVEIADDNITEAENQYYLKNLVPDAIWTKTEDTSKVNQANDKVIYVGTVQVAANEVVEIPMMLRIIDLAGNIPEDSVITKEFSTTDKDGNNIVISTNYTVEYDDKGETNETIHIDRRQPTSIEDESVVPEIVLTLPETVGTSNNDKPLYDGGFDIVFDVIDRNSGLKSVQWSIDDGLNEQFFDAGDSFTYSSETKKTQENVTITAPVSLNGLNETNSAKITITAEDNVGNTITYTYNFAVDNKAPRVTVEANNNFAEHEKYFKATREITVTVEDLNFNPDMVAIDTQLEGTKSIDTERGVYTYNYVDDGEYSLIVTKVVDLAGNTTGGQNNVEGFLDYSDCVAYNDFVIDLTAPVISLTFDNNAVKNDKYYNADRLATATIREVNFNASEVEATVTADLDGAAFNHATFDVWSGGTDHVSTVLFETDGDYNITIEYTDLAGNPAQTHVEPEFTIDKTAPDAEISNIEDRSANKGTVAPNVTFADINLDPNGYNTVVTQASMETTKEVSLSMVADEANNYKLVKHLYNDIPSDKSYDGVYVMTATVTDLAGNTDTDTKMFSVNRFGSTYIIEDPATKAIKDGYSKEAIAIEVIEINPNEVQNQSVSAIINSGNYEDYVEGETLTIVKSGSEESWKRYTYTISADAFMDGDILKQGKYDLRFLSEDVAGNKNSNETNVDLEANTCELSFTLDNTAPVVEIVNLEDDQVIEHESYDVTIQFSDGYALKKVEIYLDGELYILLEDTEEIKALSSANGEYVLTIPELDEEREINVRAVDAAGNEYTTDTLHFFINSNWFLRFYHNKPLFFGSIGGGVILIGLIVLLIKKMKNAKKAKVS